MKKIFLLITIALGTNAYATSDVITEVAKKAFSSHERDFLENNDPCLKFEKVSMSSFKNMGAMRIDSPVIDSSSNAPSVYTVLLPYEINCHGVNKSLFVTMLVKFNFNSDCQDASCWSADQSSLKKATLNY